MAEKENVNEVHEGIAGWLFLDGIRNPFMKIIRGELGVTEEVVQGWQHILGLRKAFFKKLNVQYIHVFAPEKATVYSEFLSEKADVSRGYISVFSKVFPDLFLNIVPYLDQVRRDVNVYHKTDTHWNFYGCFAAYQKICGAIGVVPNYDILNLVGKGWLTTLDLGGKFSPAKKEKIYVREVRIDAKRIFVNELVQYKEESNLENEVGLHVGSVARFVNEKAKHKKVVVLFGDSFSEYRPYLLTAMLAETFAEVHFIWSVNLDYNYISQVNPDIVVSEISERFCGTVPTDVFNVGEFSKARLKAYKKDSHKQPPTDCKKG